MKNRRKIVWYKYIWLWIKYHFLVLIGKRPIPYAQQLMDGWVDIVERSDDSYYKYNSGNPVGVLPISDDQVDTAELFENHFEDLTKRKFAIEALLEYDESSKSEHELGGGSSLVISHGIDKKGLQMELDNITDTLNEKDLVLNCVADRAPTPEVLKKQLEELRGYSWDSLEKKQVT